MNNIFDNDSTSSGKKTAMNITIGFVYKMFLGLLLIVCISFQFAIADPKGNNCDKRSPFETIDEFYGRCPPTAQSVPPPNKLLQNFAPKNDETDVQIRLRQSRVLEIYNAAVLRQDSRYQAGIATLNDHDGVGFPVKVRWYDWFKDHFQASTVYRLDIDLKLAKYVGLWQEGRQKRVYVLLDSINNYKLNIKHFLIWLKQTVLLLQPMPEPQQPTQPIPAIQEPSQNMQQQTERIPEREYTCPYDNEVESVISKSQTCLVVGLTADTMAIARIKAHAQRLITKMSSITACEGHLGRLQILVNICNDGLARWRKDMDSLSRLSQ